MCGSYNGKHNRMKEYYIRIHISFSCNSEVAATAITAEKHKNTHAVHSIIFIIIATLILPVGKA